MARRVGGGTWWEHPPTRLSCRPISIHRPSISKTPPGDPESCRRAVGRADAAGGRGRRAAPRQGRGGQRERPHVGQHLTCCRCDVDISACRTLNLREMTDQTWLHGEHSLNEVAAGVSAKKTSRLSSPDAVTRPRPSGDGRAAPASVVSSIYPPARRSLGLHPPCAGPRGQRSMDAAVPAQELPQKNGQMVNRGHQCPTHSTNDRAASSQPGPSASPGKDPSGLLSTGPIQGRPAEYQGVGTRHPDKSVRGGASTFLRPQQSPLKGQGQRVWPHVCTRTPAYTWGLHTQDPGRRDEGESRAQGAPRLPRPPVRDSPKAGPGGASAPALTGRPRSLPSSASRLCVYCA